jgi:hypothetical protein
VEKGKGREVQLVEPEEHESSPKKRKMVAFPREGAETRIPGEELSTGRQSPPSPLHHRKLTRLFLSAYPSLSFGRKNSLSAPDAGPYRPLLSPFDPFSSSSTHTTAPTYPLLSSPLASGSGLVTPSQNPLALFSLPARPSHIQPSPHAAPPSPSLPRSQQSLSTSASASEASSRALPPPFPFFTSSSVVSQSVSAPSPTPSAAAASISAAPAYAAERAELARLLRQDRIDDIQQLLVLPATLADPVQTAALKVELQRLQRKERICELSELLR